MATYVPKELWAPQTSPIVEAVVYTAPAGVTALLRCIIVTRSGSAINFASTLFYRDIDPTDNLLVALVTVGGGQTEIQNLYVVVEAGESITALFDTFGPDLHQNSGHGYEGT
jgi:hypothetical protein